MMSKRYGYEQVHKCRTCGETDPTKFYGRRKDACGKCHNQDTIRRGHEKRQFAIDLLGGKCYVCKFDKYICSMDIHHLDPSVKDKNFSSMRGWNKERIKEELNNCVLLCKNCHAAVHNDLIIL